MGAGEDILRRLDAIEAKIDRLLSAPAASGEVAADSDLDGEYGNFVVRKDPKRWSGASYVGCKLSECPPEYLDVLADFKTWQAGKEMEKQDAEATKKAGYLKRDVSRCRGWAKRLRAGWKAPERQPGEDDQEAMQY